MKDVNKMITGDTLRLIDRLTLEDFKIIAKNIGIKSTSKMYREEIKTLILKNINELEEDLRNKIVMKIYNNNKIRLGMFQYEVIDAIGISKSEFKKIEEQLANFVTGFQSVRVGDKTQRCAKYDRKYIYSIKAINKKTYERKIILEDSTQDREFNIDEVEIDNLMINTIKILNKKGYETAYCCQGHYDEKYPNQTNGYIKFKSDDISKIIRNYKKVKLPNSVKFESIHTIRFFCRGTQIEQENQIININKALKRWAERLPRIDEIIETKVKYEIEYYV